MYVRMPFPSAEIHGCTFGLVDSMNSPTQDKVAVPSPYIALCKIVLPPLPPQTRVIILDFSHNPI